MNVSDVETTASTHAALTTKPKRPPPRRHAFSLQCLRVAARQESGNVCLAPASMDGVVRLLAESMTPNHRATTLRKLDPKPGILEPQADAGYQMQHGTALYIDGSCQFEPDFALRATHLGAHIERVSGSLLESKHVFNAYAAKHTLGAIQDVCDDQLLRKSQLLLLDVIGFKAEWEKKFLKANTEQNFPFRTSPTRITPCAMMFHNSPHTFVCENSTYLAVNLRYKTNYIEPWAEFTALMPQGMASIDDVLVRLQREGFPKDYTLESLERLGLPKFKFEQSHTDLMALLQTSGMTTVREKLQITRGIYQVIHQAAQVVSVEVDEEGTEARAKTSMLGRPGAGPWWAKRTIVFDRPFAFFIHTVHSPSHLLFAGVYTNDLDAPT